MKNKFYTVMLQPAVLLHFKITYSYQIPPVQYWCTAVIKLSSRGDDGPLCIVITAFLYYNCLQFYEVFINVINCNNKVVRHLWQLIFLCLKTGAALLVGLMSVIVSLTVVELWAAKGPTKLASRVAP